MTRRRPWDEWRNAEIYREFVDAFPIYRALNERLAELARLRGAGRVLDLGCGTGATTAACARLLAATAEIVGVDASPTMIESALREVPDPRVRFLCADVLDLDELDLGVFDRVVANAAFWLFPRRGRVLSSVRRRLVPGGLFVFNVPLELLLDSESVAPEPFQLALGQAVRERTGERPFAPPRIDAEALESSLEENGFRVRETHVFRYRGRQGELMELMQVPAMASRLTSALDRDECIDLVREVADRNDPDVPVEVPWIYWLAVRNDG
jgi:SAM-dependent methyltransferase